MVRSPTAGAEKVKPKEAFLPAVKVYAAFLLLYALFFWLKPFDFPDPNVGVPRESQNLLFWLKVMSFQPLLEVAWVVFLYGMARWFSAGTLALRMTAAVFAAAAPFILILLYYQNFIPKSLFALGAAAWIGFSLWYAKGQSWEPLRELLAFMLALNAVGIALLVPMVLFTAMRSQQLFMLSQGLGGFWLLGAGALGLRQLTGLRMSRAFMAMLLSMFLQIAFAFTLHLLGVVPKEILKAILYA
jgi:hypothetical protein